MRRRGNSVDSRNWRGVDGHAGHKQPRYRTSRMGYGVGREKAGIKPGRQFLELTEKEKKRWH